MIQDPHKGHEVERFSESWEVVDRDISEFDVELAHLRRETGLRQIFVATIQTEHPLGTTPLHLHRVQAGIARDVENGFSFQRDWYGVGEPAPLYLRVIAQEMRWCGGNPVQVEIMKPRTERIHPALD